MHDRYDRFSTVLASELGVDPDVPITGDLMGQDVAKVMLARSHLKKREVWPDTMIQQQTDAALSLFLESNEACKGWHWNPVHIMDDRFAEELKSFLWKLFDPGCESDSFSLAEIIRYMEPGPGAARGANSENFYTKLFESSLTATSEHLLTLYRAAVIECPYWAEAEKYRYQNFGLLAAANGYQRKPLEIVTGSAWFSVPKSLEIRRACATEPNLNMLFQKALGAWIERRISEVCHIDLSDQQYLNQSLARMGSISGLYGTIDLKSASDRNSMAMIEEFCPPSFVRWIKLFRSPSCLLPSGIEVKMEMCSSMGNGFTFPLQTALFLGVVSCCYKLMGIPLIRNSSAMRQPIDAGNFLALLTLDGRKTPGNFGVFGDDIIVTHNAYQLCCHYLRLLGHVVNDQKSFNTGYFRESCGADFFAGYNVRGIYIKSLETPLDVYSAINRLTVWSAKHGVNLSLTMQLLLGWVKFLPVPFAAADIEGVKVPYDKTRPLGIKTAEKSVETDSQNWQAVLYKGIAIRTKAIKVPYLSREDETGDGLKPQPTNHAGWAVCAFGGYCKTPPYRMGEAKPEVLIGFRGKPDEPLRWKVKVKVAPIWAVKPILPGPVFGTDRGDAWERVANRLEFLAYLPRV